MIAHEKGFKLHLQTQTGAYSCSRSCQGGGGQIITGQITTHKVINMRVN